jgi:hypothetical protein
MSDEPSAAIREYMEDLDLTREQAELLWSRLVQYGLSVGEGDPVAAERAVAALHPMTRPRALEFIEGP